MASKNLKWQRTGNPDIDRNMQAVQQAFADGTIAGPEKVSVTKDYRVVGSESFLFVDSSRGPIVVSLPVQMAGQLVVKSVSASSNPVTVKVVDGAKIDATKSSVTVASFQSISLINDGKLWWLI